MADLTTAQINALPYAKAAFGQGFVADDYRKQFREHGERIRHWAAFPDAPAGIVGPNGETPERDGALYVESELNPEWRFLVTGVRAEVSDVDGLGQISTGACDFSCLPDELEVARLDRIVLVERPRFVRQAFAPSGEARDQLGWHYVCELVRVIGDGLPVEALLEVENDGSSFIVWPNTPPAVCRIELRVCPQYVMLGECKSPPVGAMGRGSRSALS